MLLGEFEHTLDEKNRLTLPAKFRQSFADGIVLTRWIDRCLYAYPSQDWTRLVQRLAGLDPLGQDDRRLQRFLFAAAAEAELDKQGRVMVPAPLIQHASLKREVVVAGVNDHLEIWDRAAWRAEMTEVEGSAHHVAERLARKSD